MKPSATRWLLHEHCICKELPELKIVKPSDTRWLLHEHCICKELPPLLQTLSELYESSGDAEAYGIYSILASVNGVLQLRQPYQT